MTRRRHHIQHIKVKRKVYHQPYVVESYDAASGLATLYDPWWGETITGAEDKVIGVNYTFTIERLFLTGFWTRAFVNGKVAYGRSTVYFSEGINEA